MDALVNNIAANCKTRQNSQKLISHLLTSINQTLSPYINWNSGRGPKAAQRSLKHRSVGTYQYRTTVHLYLYLYLYLYVRCNVVALTVAPLRKKEVKEVFLTPTQTSHWKWVCLRGTWSTNSNRLP